MKALGTWLKQHLWGAFLAHQFGLFILAILFLYLVRRITGRNIHLGRDPIGIVDGAALILLSIAVILLTRVFYRWIKGDDALSLGIALTPRRTMDLFIGLLIGFAFIISPWLSAILRGTASIHDSISAHFDGFAIGRILTLAFLLLLLQGVMEETVNRAFPMRLWEHRSLIFRIIVPSVFFAVIHLADEQFGFERVGVLFMAGIVQSIAYDLTGNIWLTSGLHVGANLALFSISGLWHAGAIVSLTGEPTIPNWIMIVIMLFVFSIIFVLVQRRAKLEPSPIYVSK